LNSITPPLLTEVLSMQACFYVLAPFLDLFRACYAAALIPLSIHVCIPHCFNIC
jgi:hypothetical protein